jgi:peptidoglycan hydrolase-like protein with peptidoglycan-binding domain
LAKWRNSIFEILNWRNGEIWDGVALLKVGSGLNKISRPIGYCPRRAPIGIMVASQVRSAANTESFSQSPSDCDQHHQQLHQHRRKIMPVQTISCPLTRPTLASGDTGAAVVTLQRAINARLAILGAPGALTLVADGDFGAKTLKAAKYVQCVAFLPVDGIVGPVTWSYLCGGENSLPVIAPGSTKMAVVQEVQRLLKADGYYAGSVDGIFGPQTKTAVMKYQASISVPQDGIIGPNTWVSLVLRKVTGGSCNV